VGAFPPSGRYTAGARIRYAVRGIHGECAVIASRFRSRRY